MVSAGLHRFLVPSLPKTQVLLTRLSQDSNTLRTFVTESEGMPDVEFVLVNMGSCGAESSKEGPAQTRRNCMSDKAFMSCAFDLMPSQ